MLQVPVVASNRIGKETMRTEHGDSTIMFYGNSFIAGTQSLSETHVLILSPFLAYGIICNMHI